MKQFPHRLQAPAPAAALKQVLAALGPIGLGVLISACLFALLHGLLQADLLIRRGEHSVFQVELVRAQASALQQIDTPDPVSVKDEKSRLAPETVSGPPKAQRLPVAQRSIEKRAEAVRSLAAKREEPVSKPEEQAASDRAEPVESLPLNAHKQESISEAQAAHVAHNAAGTAAGKLQSKPMKVVHRPAPHYPRRARRRGIEGDVVVGFTVTSSGGVEQVRVIEAVPKGYFEDAALEAARQFRFSPAVVGGEVIAVADVRNRFSFRLQD